MRGGALLLRSEIRANAADALLDVPAGGAAPGERGAPWAFALVASGAIVPLLSLVQSVRRDGNDGLKPVECPENTPAVVTAGDTALLILAECAAVAAALLAEEGWEVAYDEDADRPIFVDENSGMSQSVPPTLASTRGDWTAALLVETLTLVQPLSVHPRTGDPRWPVRVLRHVPDRVDPATGAYHPSLSVLDVALEEGDDAERTRVLARGPWMGSDGDVEGERDPEEPPGIALDTWRDATVAAALALDLGGRAKTGRARRGRVGWGRETPLGAPPARAPTPTRAPRALASGLGCGATASFLRAKIPGVAVDAVEPDEETTRAARDFFSVDFDEERWSELTPAGRSARIARVPGTVPGGVFRAWSGVALDAFLADDAAKGAFDAVIGDFPIGTTDTHVDDTFDAISRVLRPEGGVVAVAVRDPRAFRDACAAAARAIRRRAGRRRRRSRATRRRRRRRRRRGRRTVGETREDDGDERGVRGGAGTRGCHHRDDGPFLGRFRGFRGFRGVRGPGDFFRPGRVARPGGLGTLRGSARGGTFAVRRGRRPSRVGGCRVSRVERVVSRSRRSGSRGGSSGGRGGGRGERGDDGWARGGGGERE